MRIVVKVGTSTLAHPTGRLNIQRVETLVKVLSDLKNAGHEMVLVSSGAIAAGKKAININKQDVSQDDPIAVKQACAAVGQARLMMVYQKIFSEEG